jgi:hypothetical protein
LRGVVDQVVQLALRGVHWLTLGSRLLGPGPKLSPIRLGD